MQADSVPPIGGVVGDFEVVPLGAEDIGEELRACMSCGAIAPGTFYLVNDQRTCETCVNQAPPDESTGFGRFSRALTFGTIAAIVCGGLWYAVTAVTGYELGLIALVVGLVVGIAVRIGSRERGGWLYQAMAVGLTYLAIVSTYVPVMVEALAQGAMEESAPAEAADPIDELGAVPPPTPAAAPLAVTEPPPQALLYAVAIPLAIMSPILVLLEDFAGALMWLLIIGIALFEAWKVNQGKGGRVVKGPFRTAEAS